MAIGAVGATAVILAAAIALTRVEPGLPAAASFLAACRQMVPFPSGPAVLLVIALVALGLVVAALAFHSLVRQLRERRRFLRSLHPVATVEVGAHAVTLIESERPQAFCAGWLRPRIYASTAARELLSEVELEAVIAHEAHHQASRDPLRVALSKLLAETLFFLPGMRRLSRRYRELIELAADEAAVAVADERTLASALLAFGERRGAPGAVVGIAPERVDHLLGHGHRWNLPLSIFLGSLVIVSVLLAVALTLPTLVARESVNPAMALAEACMVAMAAAPVAVAVIGVALSRNRLRRAGAC